MGLLPFQVPSFGKYAFRKELLILWVSSISFSNVFQNLFHFQHCTWSCASLENPAGKPVQHLSQVFIVQEIYPCAFRIRLTDLYRRVTAAPKVDAFRFGQLEFLKKYIPRFSCLLATPHRRLQLCRSWFRRCSLFFKSLWICPCPGACTFGAHVKVAAVSTLQSTSEGCIANQLTVVAFQRSFIE